MKLTGKKGRRKEHKKIQPRELLAYFLIICAVLVTVTAVYTSDYYHADESVKELNAGTAGLAGESEVPAVGTEELSGGSRISDRTILSSEDTGETDEVYEDVSVNVSRESSSAVTFLPVENEAQENLHTGLIFYPGGKVEYTAYEPLMEKLARRGITCILVHMPCNLAILNINAADSLIEDYNSSYGTDQPVENWIIGGHSLGGAAAAMYLANGHTKEYKGLLLLASYSGSDLSESGLSVLSVYGENDGVMNREKYEEDRKNLPEDTEEQVIPGGCHAYFGSYGEQEGDGKAQITPDEQQEITADAVKEWVLSRF